MVAVSWQNKKACVNPIMLTRTFFVTVSVFLRLFCMTQFAHNFNSNQSTFVSGSTILKLNKGPYAPD